MTATGILLVSCPDQPGIVAAVASFVAAHGGNVIDLQQHTDHTDSAFFQRVEFELDHVDLGREEIADAFAPVADRYAMQWSLRFSDERLRVGVLASKEPHCLQDTLNRWRTGELPVDVTVVVSNHPDHAELARWFGVPYHHVPIVDGDRATQEERVREALIDHGVDLVVLARYMQVLSPELCAAWPERIINIHHSFLPAFIGAAPYRRAKERGVKLVGATAHYVTEELDDGPIIEQDVVRVDHRHSVDDLTLLGADVERVVLSRAVLWHCQDRIIRYGNQTVVF